MLVTQSRHYEKLNRWKAKSRNKISNFKIWDFRILIYDTRIIFRPIELSFLFFQENDDFYRVGRGRCIFLWSTLSRDRSTPLRKKTSENEGIFTINGIKYDTVTLVIKSGVRQTAMAISWNRLPLRTSIWRTFVDERDERRKSLVVLINKRDIEFVKAIPVSTSSTWIDTVHFALNWILCNNTK